MNFNHATEKSHQNIQAKVTLLRLVNTAFKVSLHFHWKTNSGFFLFLSTREKMFSLVLISRI